MSRANARVKFPDGTIKHGIYNGTVDVYMRFLAGSNEEAWNIWERYRSSGFNSDLFENPNDTKEFDVEIADDYGGGDCYIGRATKSQITSTVIADDMKRKGNGGKPDWWEEGDDLLTDKEQR